MKQKKPDSDGIHISGKNLKNNVANWNIGSKFECYAESDANGK